MTDDVDNLTPEEADEIMTALRASGRFTGLEAGRELIRLRAENSRQAALLAWIESRLDFLFIGFIDATDPKAISLSSEHSVGEQIVKMRKIVRQKKGE